MNSKKKLTGIMMFVLVFTIILSSTMAAFGASGKWIKAGNGKWWYRHTDTSYTTNDWEKINNKWYHFDNKGWMQTGWLKIKNQWYYLNPNGDMATGWKKVRGDWYYLNSNGAMATGWKQYKGDWYFLDEEDGFMYEDTFIYWNDNEYYLKSNGVMATKWCKIDEDWWAYFGTSGAMCYNQWIGDDYVDYYGMWREDPSIHLDEEYFGLIIAYADDQMTDESEMIAKISDDSKLVSAFAEYLSTLEVTTRAIDEENVKSLYDAMLCYNYQIVDGEPDFDFEDFMIFADENALFYDGIMYNIDMNEFKTFWDACEEVEI